jgi:hypothetical protein
MVENTNYVVKLGAVHFSILERKRSKQAPLHFGQTGTVSHLVPNQVCSVVERERRESLGARLTQMSSPLARRFWK